MGPCNPLSLDSGGPLPLAEWPPVSRKQINFEDYNFDYSFHAGFTCTSNFVAGFKCRLATFLLPVLIS